MIAKEKAKEIIEKFEKEIGCSDFHIPEFITGVPVADGSEKYTKILNEETTLLAKQCALIAVEQLIEFDAPRYKYWKEVKKEIKKIKWK